jgi:hypothetical protein
LFVDASGNVAIAQAPSNAASFTRSFNISAENASIALRGSSSGVYASQGIFFAVDSVNYAQIHNDGVGQLIFRTGSGLSERARIDSSGRLGLGVSSPTSLLHLADAGNIQVGTTTGTKIGTAAAQKLGFFGVTPVVQQTELTDELTTITHTAPGTADFAIQNLSLTGYGFVTEDEGNTVLSVIANLQARVNELETKLVALGFLADAD